MYKYKVKLVGKKSDWERFLLSRKPQSFLQSWNWGETNKLVGSKVFRLGFYDKRGLVGVCLVIEQKAKRGSHLLIPAGPVIDWKDNDLVQFFMFELEKLAKKQHAWFVRMRPELESILENNKLMKRWGFRSAPMHLHAENTWVLDITGTEQQILAGMRKNTRYLVKKSLAQGLKVEIRNDDESVKILADLQKETVERHGFVGFSKKLFAAQLSTFGKSNEARLFVCKKGKEALAAAIIIFHGDYAYYHHSASTMKYPKLPVSYFMQWRIIQEAKRRGKKVYNFWGIAPEGKKRHRFDGVTTFKKGFGGERVDWVHAQDYVVSPKYYLTYLFEIVRKSFRRL